MVCGVAQRFMMAEVCAIHCGIASLFEACLLCIIGIPHASVLRVPEFPAESGRFLGSLSLLCGAIAAPSLHLRCNGKQRRSVESVINS